MKSEARILPIYLRNSSKLNKSLVFDDTEVGYGLRATEKHIPSFEEKIATIINYSIYALNATENKYKKLIKEILPNEKILEEESITNKIQIFGISSFTQKHNYHYIQSSYIDIFNTLREIFLQFGIFLERNPEKHIDKKSPISENDLIKALHDAEVIGNTEFRDRVLSLIFPLHIQIYEINKIINSPPGIPADPAVKIIRSSIGGAVKNYGESVLFEKIFDFLSTKRPSSNKIKHSDITKLFKEHEKNLTDILKNYQDTIGHPIKTGGPIITYGRDLTTKGLIRKMRQWNNDNPNFNTELKNHIKEKIQKQRKSKVKPQARPKACDFTELNQHLGAGFINPA